MGRTYECFYRALEVRASAASPRLPPTDAQRVDRGEKQSTSDAPFLPGPPRNPPAAKHRSTATQQPSSSKSNTTTSSNKPASKSSSSSKRQTPAQGRKQRQQQASRQAAARQRAAKQQQQRKQASSGSSRDGATRCQAQHPPATRGRGPSQEPPNHRAKGPPLPNPAAGQGLRATAPRRVFWCIYIYIYMDSIFFF